MNAASVAATLAAVTDRRRAVLSGIAWAVLVLWAAAPVTAQTGIAVGEKAPVVSVQDLEGRPVDLGRWIGKQPVFLEFWASWCTNCAEMLPRVKTAAKQFGEAVAFLGVNVTVNQTPDRAKRYVETEKPPYLALWDADGASRKAYKVPGTSYVVIIDRAGKVAYTGFGGKQQFETALAKVGGATH